MSDIKFTLETLGGKKSVILTPVKVMEAGRVIHKIKQIIAKLIAGGATKGGLGVAEAFASIDYDEMMGIADALLRDCIIDGEEIHQPSTSEYFAKNPLDIELLIVEAVKQNWPQTFQMLAGKFGDLIPSELRP